MEDSRAFSGFPKETIRFLHELRANNNRAWFEQNKSTYEACIVAPGLAFAAALADELAVFAPGVVAEPRVGGSLFRIHRDTRFSVNKTPYKTHVGIRIRDQDTATSTRCTGPLFYVEFDAERLHLGVGVKDFDAPLVAAYRKAVSTSESKGVFSRAVATAEAARDHVLGGMLARTPSGYDDQGDTLIRRKGFFVQRETGLPKQLHDRGFAAYCAGRLEPYASVFAELRRLAIAAMA